MFSLTEFTQHISKALVLSIMSLSLAILFTPIYTYFAYKHKLWKRSRTHSASGDELKVISKLRIKRTIPLMAGLVIILATTLVTVLFNLDRAQTWLPLAALLGGGTVGLIDDIINVRGSGGNVAGLRPKLKLAMVLGVSAIAAWFFYYKLGYSSILLPFVGEFYIGILLIPLFILVVVSTSNAVNISDGMDGLAGGCLISAFGAFAVISALQGNFGISGFCLTVVGALLAYVWFNIPPARFIMGDVGSFSLGMTLGVVAMLTDTLVLLPLIAIVFVAEAGSSLLQILSKKFLGKKIFLAAPIHHHYNAQGWPKTKVTMRFWVISQVSAALGVALALIGGFIK